MYHIIFDNRDTGKFVGITTDESPYIPDGLSYFTINEDPPDLKQYKWDHVNGGFVKVVTRQLTKLDFMSRFTAQERISVLQSNDPVIKDAMNLLQMAEFVDLADPRTTMLVGYLAMSGIITNERVSEILT
jgi:hypothetical protein